MKHILLTLTIIVSLLFSGCHHNKEKVVTDGFAELQYDIWWGDWYEEREKISQDFQKERKRLGPNFGRALYEMTNDEYMKDDLDMYYNLSSMLTIDGIFMEVSQTMKQASPYSNVDSHS